MIKALLLIIAPGPTWEGIAQVRRSVLFLLVLYLLPLLVLTSAAEAYGLIHWGRMQGIFATHHKDFSRAEAAIFEAAQFLLSLLLVFVCAAVIRTMGDTFHNRSTYRDTFGLVAYALSPVFLLRLGDVFPTMSPWLTWGIGIGLSLLVLYSGVPRMMEPDLAHAFGLYVTSAVLLVMSTGVLRLITANYLGGKLPRVEAVISQLAGRLHFQ